jgi:3-hydroxypropanoate dehydrogenase
MSDTILSDRDLDLIFREARTFNGYTDQPVTTTQLRAIYDLARMGPTSANTQPGRFLFLTSQEAKDRLAACASATNAPKISKAPVTVIVAHDLEFYEKIPQLLPHAPEAVNWFKGNDAVIQATAFRNSTLQSAYLILAARAIGLGAGPMSGFDNAAVDAAFLAGKPWKSNMIITLGYGDPASTFPRSPRLSFDEAASIL